MHFDTEKQPVKWPLASVVVLTRNRAASLERTLKALRALSYPDYEIIVVDNGSTDHTPQVISKSSAGYVLCPPNRGLGQCRQDGVDAAKGEIIAMCDDDCVPDREWLHHLVRRLCSAEDLGMVGGHVVNLGFPESKRYKGRTKMGRNGILTFVTDPQEADFFGSANMAFKRVAMQAIGGYDPFFRAGREEMDLAMGLRRKGFRIDYEPAAVVNHHFTGISLKGQRLFYSGHLMRLYFYLKYFEPHTLASWLSFLGYELQLLGQDLWRLSRPIAGAMLKLQIRRWPGLGIRLFKIVSPRLAIPWLLWRARARRLRETKFEAMANA